MLLRATEELNSPPLLKLATPRKLTRRLLKLQHPTEVVKSLLVTSLKLAQVTAKRRMVSRERAKKRKDQNYQVVLERRPKPRALPRTTSLGMSRVLKMGAGQEGRGAYQHRISAHKQSHKDVGLGYRGTLASKARSSS